jgi:hypothetical protein
MPANATEHQRETMRSLFRMHLGDIAATCAAYARAEANGHVFRKGGDFRLSSEDYAKALLVHGLETGWIR